MKIVLTSIGTRGDMEPFLAVGEILKEKGHQVICNFPEQFRKLADDSGFEFASLGAEFMDMLDSPEGRLVMGGGRMGFKKLRAFIKLAIKGSKLNKGLMQKQKEAIDQEKPDLVIHHGKAIYPVIWGIENDSEAILLVPIPFMHYVKDHAHIAFNKNYGPRINKWTYGLVNFILIRTIIGSTRWIKTKRKYKQKEIQNSLFNNKTIYALSPTLFSRPNYWADNLQVLGYHERKKTNHWKPSAELEYFLNKNDKVMMVTFGSMINDAPIEKTAIIMDILARLNMPAIINIAGGGLVEPENYNKELFHFVQRIPYDWLLPKVYAVIHHGGSGTTHSVIKYGCASLIIPHIIDQYVWNKIAHKKGVGPLGMDVGRITTKNLEPKIQDLILNPQYKARAKQLGQTMRSEDFKADLYQYITNNISQSLD